MAANPRLSSAWRRRIWGVGLGLACALVGAGLPASGRAQAVPASGPAPRRAISLPVDDQEFDAPSDLSLYSNWNWINPLCSGLYVEYAVTGDFDASCFGDGVAETESRQQVRARDRMARTGVLMVLQVWAAVETVKNIIQGSQSVVRQIQALAASFSKKHTTGATLRVANALDQVSQAIDGMAQPQLLSQVPLEGARYAQFQALSVRALGVSRDASEHSTTLSDQATAMQLRLNQLAGKGTPGTVTVGGGGAGGPAADAVPALPDDAPVDAQADDAALLGGLYGASAILAPGTSFLRAALAPAPGLHGTATVGVAAVRPGASALRAYDIAQCVVTGDDGQTQDPQVLYQRASIMAIGAQTQATVPAADAIQTREEIRGMMTRERQHRRESFLVMLLKAFHML